MPFPAIKRAVIHQPWGGLGDNLQFSTLPELFAAQGIESFISIHNAARNPEIHKLVWDHNPFIKGISADEPNAGASVPYDKFSRRQPFLERIERAHGLKPVSRYPKIYYRPNRLPELANAILLDLSSISVQHRSSELRKYVAAVVSDHGYDPACILQVRFDRAIAKQPHHNIDLPEFQRFRVTDIFHYCDVLSSCKALIAVHSGAQSLAVALRGDAARPAIHCFCAPNQFNEGDFIFPDVDYRIAERPLLRSKLIRSILKRVPANVRAYIDSRS